MYITWDSSNSKKDRKKEEITEIPGNIKCILLLIQKKVYSVRFAYFECTNSFVICDYVCKHTQLDRIFMCSNYE